MSYPIRPSVRIIRWKPIIPTNKPPLASSKRRNDEKPLVHHTDQSWPSMKARKQQALGRARVVRRHGFRGCHVEACDRWPQADKRVVALAPALQQLRRSVPALVRAPNYFAIYRRGRCNATANRQQQPVLSCILARWIDRWQNNCRRGGGSADTWTARKKQRQAANLSPSDRSRSFPFPHFNF